MGIEKTMLLAAESIYWINMDTDIEATKHCTTCLDFQAALPKVKAMVHKYQEGHGNL